MFRMFGQIAIDIVGIVEAYVLVSIRNASPREFSDHELIERAADVFEHELPGHLKTHFVAWEEEPKKVKHVLSADGETLFRLDKGPYVARVSRCDNEGDFQISGQNYVLEPLAGQPDDKLRLQAGKWFKARSYAA